MFDVEHGHDDLAGYFTDALAGKPRVPKRHRDWLAEKFPLGSFYFVPLVTGAERVSCGIHVLMLRPESGAMLVNSGDIDNRLKTLFDALRKPHDISEL